MDHGQSRIPCPKCRANNFLGQPTCWQCGSSLPPPEAAGHPAAPAPAQAPFGVYATPQSPSRGPRWALIVVPLVLVALLGAGVFALFASKRKAAPTAPEQLQDQVRALQAQQDKMMKEGGTGVSDINSLDPDSTEARAQRELKRLREKAGLAAPPVGPGGDVRLQNGGTLTPEQYQKALNGVRSGTRYNPP